MEDGRGLGWTDADDGGGAEQGKDCSCGNLFYIIPAALLPGKISAFLLFLGLSSPRPPSPSPSLSLPPLYDCAPGLRNLVTFFFTCRSFSI